MLSPVIGQQDDRPRPVRCLVISEYTIGHVPYVDTLERCARTRDDIVLHVVRLRYPVAGALRRVPGYRSNWSVRASVRARRVPKRIWDESEVVLVHTQTSSLLLPGRMRRTPTWISSDATPVNFDEIGRAYGHRRSVPAVEWVKRAVLRRAYGAAAGIVAWSGWVERSLVRDYGVRPERIHVVRPGPVLPPRIDRRGRASQVRLLFVGGDFARKGGHDLLTAFRGLVGDVRLDVVTHTDVPEEPGVHVHRGVTAGAPALLQLYGGADIAVLPTLGDASPYAVVEAMAHGLPVVTTDVGAIREAVLPERTGLLVPAADPLSLRRALQRLVDQPHLRREMGRQARERAEQVYDGHRNAGLVLELLRDTALQRRGTRGQPAASG